MLRLVITFLILAIIAGYFGFSTVEGMSIDIAKILFFIFLVLFVLSLLASILIFMFWFLVAFSFL